MAVVVGNATLLFVTISLFLATINLNKVRR